jgi:hexokinase
MIQTVVVRNANISISAGQTKTYKVYFPISFDDYLYVVSFLSSSTLASYYGESREPGYVEIGFRNHGSVTTTFNAIWLMAIKC